MSDLKKIICSFVLVPLMKVNISEHYNSRKLIVCRLFVICGVEYGLLQL